MILAQTRTPAGELTPWESATADWLDVVFADTDVERVAIALKDSTTIFFERA